MIIDALNKFNSAQAITAAAASTDYINLGAARDIGTGENLYVVTIVNTTFADTGSNSTLTVDLYGDSTTTFTPDGTQTLYVIPALAAAGSKYIARIQPDFAGQYQYLEIFYTPNNGDLSAGAVTTFITHDVDKWKAYADAITIS